MTPSTEAAPRASTRQQILAFFDGRPGKHSTGEISTHVNAPQNTIYTTLSDMVARGELVRVSLGQYCLTGDPAAAGVPQVADPRQPASAGPGPARAKPAPPPAEATSEDAPIELAIWHTGELTLRRDDVALVLAADEVRTLSDFLARVMAP